MKLLSLLACPLFRPAYLARAVLRSPLRMPTVTQRGALHATRAQFDDDGGYPQQSAGATQKQIEYAKRLSLQARHTAPRHASEA